MKGIAGHLFRLLVRVDEELPSRGAFHSSLSFFGLLLEIIACAKSI